MARATLRVLTIATLAGALAAGCEQETAAPAGPALGSGYWQASIALPGGNIETGIEISQDGGSYSASLVNGQERVRIDEVTFADDELRLRFPAFNNEIRATLGEQGLRGTLTLVKRFGDTQVMPFEASRDAGSTGEDGASASHDLSGRWAVRFHEPDGTDTASIGEFAQRGSRLYGTFLNPNGDHRFLAGHVRGDAFHLSTFDGAHAFLFAGTVGDDGRIVDAGFWSGTTWYQTWSAERNEVAELPDAFSRTWLKPGYDRFEFEFPNEHGLAVSLADEKFRGKVVMVALAGTWCPNCNDEARFLAPFYRAYRDQGLEIVTLLFEHFDDPGIAAAQAKAFRAKHGIEYDTLIAGLSDKADAARVLPQLSAVLAFPTTIFIDRDGRVREIHTGFSGPGTGEHYVRLKATFTDLVATLLAEPPNLIESLSGDETTDAN